MAELIAALDLPNADAALKMAMTLQGVVQWLKIGSGLFISSGRRLVSSLQAEGFRVFLDLKFYDIPNTVANAVAAAGELKVDMLTCHCQGGERMCKAALDQASRFAHPPLVFGVTALTSFAAGEMPGVAISPWDYGLYLARLASEWGMPGIVCSGVEAGRIKEACPGLLRLCPGIRPQGAGNADQRRVVTPRQAVENGADFIVVGRPVIEAQNPRQAALAILEEMDISAS